MADAEATFREILGTNGDPEVLDYIVSVLGDESFEFGDDCEEALDALGPLLVSMTRHTPWC